MRENEFEKQVQQKMNDFNLHPSAEVWTEVERRIRKEKKRRLIFWWPLLFGLLAGGIGIGILLTNKKESIAEQNIAKNETVKKELIDTSVKQSVMADAIKNNSNDTVTSFNSIKIAGEIKEKILSGQYKRQIALEAQHQLTTDKAAVSKKKSKKLNSEVDSIWIVNDRVVKDDLQIVVVQDKKQDKIISIAVDSVVVAKNETGTLTDSHQKKLPEIAMLQVDTVAKNSVGNSNNKLNNKWSWELSIGGGRSSVVNTLGQGLFKSAGVQSGFGLGAQPGTSSVPSPVSYAGSWQMALQVKKDISKKLELRAGLGYIYLSSKMMVGNRVDSPRSINNNFSSDVSVNNFYRLSGSSGGDTYHNRYHFVTLSVDLSWRIITGKKTQLFWKNGLEYGRLFSSSMLHVDYNLPGYYKDNSLLQKNQLFIFTGLSMPVNKRWVLNPFMKYSLSKVLKDNSADNTHFGQFGLQINYRLNK